MPHSGDKLTRGSPITFRRRPVYPSILVTVTLLIFACFQYSPFFSSRGWPFYSLQDGFETTQGQWRWSNITPSTEIEWHQCFDDFECARLDVPLDWEEPSNDTRAFIAVIRLRATDLDNYGGAVFTNPGGPGGSGVFALRDRGKLLQTVVGKNYDIISFDPRGVGATSPKVACLTSAQNSKVWSLLDVGVVDSHPGVLFDAFARSSALSQACASSMGGGDTSNLNAMMTANDQNVLKAGPLRFLSTNSVARDMLEIMHKVGEQKLRYWGFSYGTVLGVTFAAMFPDKIERMINDGNVDIYEWTSGSGLHFLHDADKVMDAFYTGCHSAGPIQCPFYESSPKAIEERLDTLLANLKVHPIVVPAAAGSMDLPEVIYYSSAKRLISTALYRPIFMFPKIAAVLASMESGDGEPFVDFMTGIGFRAPFECANSLLPDGDDDDAEGTEDAFKVVMCTDSAIMNDTVEEFENYAQRLISASKAAGAVQTVFRLSCAGWKIQSKWRFEGPYGGNTSFPILFIANTADNVTPLRSALKNSQRFPDSTLLIQDSYGHTTLATPSMCTAKHIRAYFQDGAIPKNGTVCAADTAPFKSTINLQGTFDSQDQEVGAALLELAMSKSGLSRIGM